MTNYRLLSMSLDQNGRIDGISPHDIPSPDFSVRYPVECAQRHKKPRRRE